jgi:hypothetical protein
MTTEEMIESFMLKGGAVTICPPKKFKGGKIDDDPTSNDRAARYLRRCEENQKQRLKRR